jgi:uncharacterized protein YyaL (SSP411 family)
VSDLHFSPRPNRASEIQWREWGEGAFRESEATAKPVVLAISAVWCHWCHVMDETTYSTEPVIRLLNERFIPVRVDNDRRPDVNARYNMGGWPTTAVLTPDGEIVHGGTYIPPDAMLRLLGQIDHFYSAPDNRLELSEHIRRAKDERARGRSSDTNGATNALDARTAEVVLSQLEEQFDQEYGGFGDEQKFPQTGTLHFMLDHWARTRDPRDEKMTLATLRGMAGGGMYDHVEGGFFRYSTTRDYSVPHFEKMLEDLGGLLLACARADAAFAAKDLGLVARDVKRYLDATLWQAERGAYGGSQDADEAYFHLDAAERTERTAPYVDPTIYTSWNAETARSLLLAAPLLRGADSEFEEWTARGLAILETLWSRLLRDGLMCRYFDGAPHVRGLLGDQAWSIAAALAAHTATGDGLWLVRAGDLIVASDALYDGSGGYADRLTSEGEPGRLSDRAVPFSENAIMARSLLAYSAAAAQPAMADRARAILGRFEPDYRRYGVFAAAYASAVMDAVEPPVSAVIVGSPGGAAGLRRAALSTAWPAISVIPVDPGAESERLERLGHAATADSGPVTYLCHGTSCFARVTSQSDLSDALARYQPA